MSLILDALRKSEAERRRGNLPALALELPPSAPRAHRPRAWWLAFPVAVALGALAFWLVRPDAAETAQPAADPPALEPQAIHSPDAGPRATGVPAADASITDADAPPTRAPAAPGPPPAAQPPPAPVPVPATPTAPIPSPVPVLELADLTPDERRALPALKLSMHMWSPDPASRFVILDGHRLGEGDRAGNAVVERIDSDGVILAADGRRIRLALP